ncbi:hypothetical protein AC1031_018014 [Aphanomyces cochlioides]|nr:hypothetical protein AC1031_018014 [Aphanomyces cochlioides]
MTEIAAISEYDYSTDEILFDAQFSDMIETDPLHKRRLSNRQRARETRRRELEHLSYLRHRVAELTATLEFEKRKRGINAVETVKQEYAQAVAVNHALKAELLRNNSILNTLYPQLLPEKPKCWIGETPLQVVVSL